MKRSAWVWAAVIVALGAGLVVGRLSVPGAPRGAGGDPPATQSSKGHAAPPPLVGVAHPKRVTIPRTLSLTANINSLSTAVILPKTSGYLETVSVRPGDLVRAGQVVAVVDHAQLDTVVAQGEASVKAAQTAVQTAQASVAAAHAQQLNAVAARQNALAQLTSAKAGVVKAHAQLVDMQATHARIAALVKQGAEAQQNLDDATNQVESAQADLDAALAQVKVAEAQVAQADAQIEATQQQEAAAVSQVRTAQMQVSNQDASLENARLQATYATIVAPFDGIVVSRSLDPGAYVTPGTSTPILTIANLDQIDVVVNVTEVEIASIHPGTQAQIRVDAYPGRTFQGVVTRIAGGADPVTRTVQVEIDIPNPGHLLRPGMYGTVTLSVGADRNVLVVPLAALVTVGSDHFVWVVTDDKVSRRPVIIGRATGEIVEITSGVQDSDTVVSRGIDLVREGQQVHTVPVGL